LGIIHITYTLFAKRLRLSNPWNFKVPVLISVTYLMMLGLQFAFEDALLAFGWSLCTILGIAGFGYLSNDLGDRTADRKAGKPNLLSEIPAVQIAALMVLFLALAMLPWVFFFPLNLLTGTLLGTEFLLFVLYVLPPFRLKERGLLGILTDALYAHVIPAILAALTFGALADTFPRKLTHFLIGVGLWQLCLGMRNILLHQLKDATNDRTAGLQTFVTQVGEARANRWLKMVFVPLELLSWLLFLILIGPITWLPLVGWPIYFAWKFHRQQQLLDFRGWLYRYLDDFYIPYFPLLVLTSLCVDEPRMLVIAAAHLLLFKSAFSPARDRIFSMTVKPS
jgi:4-hydroxybenzoate polyprenyltransferase